MSAAEDESEDTDLPHQMSSDGFQNAQIVKQRSFRSSEDDIASLHSNGFVPEASLSDVFGDQSVPTRLHDSKPLQVSNRPVVPALAHNPFAEEESYFTRPNRYFGPDSTWLSWTKGDRLVAQTLDRLRSQNLSIHLFNAYALKRYAQASTPQNQKDLKGKARARSVDADNEFDGHHVGSFIPQRTWTAWPLPPNQVPRDSELLAADDYETYSMEPDARPSAVLEDSIIATTTRYARQKWSSRNWAQKSTITATRPIKVEHGGDAVTVARQQTSVCSESEAVGTLSTESESGSEVFESQPWGRDEQQASQAQPVEAKSEAEASDIESERHPTPIADDDSARSILLPSTRHILSKVDDLLMGLHHARQAYATTRPYASRDQKSGESEDSDTTEGDHSDTRSQPGRKRKRPVHSIPGAPRESQAKHLRRSKDPLGLRDWSDAIGMAALTGWDPAVVQRAGERCAILFSENMMFRTFFHGDPAGKEKSDFTEHFAVHNEASGTEDDTSEEDKQVTLTRTSRACKTCTRLKERCEPVGGSAEGVGPCGRCMTHDEVETCSGITATFRPQPTAARSGGLTCPHPTCERHHTPFKKSSHLQRHIDSVHRRSYPPRVPSSPSRPSSSGGEYLSAPATEIVCPIQACPRNEKGFSRGHHLYQHISKMHPEVSLDEVKRLEKTRRGDKRGKWSDNRRRRPASRSRSKSMRVGKEKEGGGSDSDE